MSKKVLITGAFGFVGSNLSVYLVGRGYELWALDVKDSSRILKFESSKVEGCNKSSYAREFSWEHLDDIPWSEIYAVVHLAGKAHDTKSTGDPQSYFDINTGLTKKIAEKFSRKDSKAQSEERKFVLFSSVKAVADRVEGVLTEEAKPDPQTPYGQSKLEAESLLRPLSGHNGERKNNSRTHALTHLHTYILRPCMIHGPGNKGNLNLLYGVVRKGIPWPLGAFKNQRSFAAIENICAVVSGLLEGNVESGIFQVADDEVLSTNELIEMIAQSMGRRPRVWHMYKGFISFIAKVGDLLHLPLNSERLKKLTESYIVSNDKIKGVLGWDKMPVSAKEGMLKTLKSFSRKGAKAQRRQLNGNGQVKQ